MFILLSGQAPFSGANNNEVFAKVRKAKLQMNTQIWKEVSESGKSLIKKLICKNINQRYDSQQALSHPWFTDVRSSQNSADGYNLFKKFHNLLIFR